jgi:hypothetical protein
MQPRSLGHRADIKVAQRANNEPPPITPATVVGQVIDGIDDLAGQALRCPAYPPDSEV